jgi:hypothetical protein
MRRGWRRKRPSALGCRNIKFENCEMTSSMDQCVFKCTNPFCASWR